MSDPKYNMVKRTHIKKPYYVLEGSYEGEFGETIIDRVLGGSLEDCVRKVLLEHPEFGDTFLEVGGGYLEADYDVSRAAWSMAQWIKQEGAE